MVKFVFEFHRVSCNMNTSLAIESYEIEISLFFKHIPVSHLHHFRFGFYLTVLWVFGQQNRKMLAISICIDSQWLLVVMRIITVCLDNILFVHAVITCPWNWNCTTWRHSSFVFRRINWDRIIVLYKYLFANQRFEHRMNFRELPCQPALATLWREFNQDFVLHEIILLAEALVDARW